jgi:hypothetical protein
MRIVFALAAALVLSACADPAKVAQIRPGLGAEANLDAARPPSGVTYAYRVEQNGLPIPAGLTLTSRRLSPTSYRYNGFMSFEVPGDPENLKQVGALVSKAFRTRAPRIQGNKVFIPITIRTDNRFRSTASSLLAGDDKFTPHDCFAVLGTCTYTASRGGAQVGFISETSERDGIWRTITRLADGSERNGMREVMTYSLDKNAVVLDLAISTRSFGDRRVTTFRRQGVKP